MLNLRIFISSPGDVSEERRIAVETLRALEDGALLRDRVNLQIVAWDDPVAGAPMDARDAPQASVNRWAGRPADCDLTIAILWSRIGTPLGPQMTRADGSRYASGTVWEVEDAIAADRPVFVYRRTDKPRIDLDDPDFAERRGQYDAVRKWFDTLRDADGAWRSGINEYAGPEQFRQLLRAHLEAFIGARLASQQEPAVVATRSLPRATVPSPTASPPRRWLPLAVVAAAVLATTIGVWRWLAPAPTVPVAAPASVSQMPKVTAPEAARPTAGPGTTAVFTRSLPAVTLAAPAEVVFTQPSRATYTVLGITPEALSPGSYGLRIRLRLALPAGGGGANFWDSSFRLLIDGVPRAPESRLNELVDAGGAKDADIVFAVPDGTQTLVLRIIHHDAYNAVADLPLAIEGAGAARREPRLPPGPRSVDIDGPRELVFTKGGRLTYTVLDLGTQALQPGLFGLTLRVRLYCECGGGGANFWDDSFRLLVDGVPREPISRLNLVVENRAARDGDVSFEVPASARTLALRVIPRGGDGIQADLPLTLGPAAK